MDLRSPGDFQEEMKLYFDLEHQQNSERWKREGSQGPGADENKGLLKAQKLNKKKKKSDAYFHDPVEAWLRGSEESLPKQLAVGHPGSQNWVMVFSIPHAAPISAFRVFAPFLTQT